PVMDKFWRLARLGEEVVWSTSPDNASYTELGRASGTRFAVMQPQLVAFRDPQGGSFSTVVDNVNPGMPTGQTCPTSNLRDEFDGAELAPHWSRSYLADCTYGVGVAKLEAMFDPV